MSWNAIAGTLARVRLPDPYRYELLARHEVPALVDDILAWYPEISVGVASGFVDPAFYERLVAFDGDGDEGPRPFTVVLIKHGDARVGLLACESEREAQTLYGRLSIVAPAHRGAGLGQHNIALIEAVGRALGMGLVYGMATLKIPQVQRAFERLGWQPIGITPGYDRELVAPGVVKRVYEAVYAKVLAGPGDLVLPEARNLTPRTRELFDLLFPGRMPRGGRCGALLPATLMQ